MPNPVLERIPQLRRVTNTPFVRRGLTVARQHKLLDEPVRFAVGEIRGGTRAYRLAADPNFSIVVRHRSGDTGVFAEIFKPPLAYEPPPAAAAVLRDLATHRRLRVLDLGGNVGLFAVDVLLRYPGAEVTSYEPEPENFRILARCAALNRVATWDVVQACAMTAHKPVRVTLGGQAHAHVSETGVEVRGVDVLPLLANYDFVKMDIEGSEWPILRDERWPVAMRDVAAFVLEWHDRGSFASDPRTAALEAVKAAGFSFQAGPPGRDHGMIWGWRAASHRGSQARV